MGDLRNKMAKLERAEREARSYARWAGLPWPPEPDRPYKPPEPYRCQGCGLSHYEVTVYAIHNEGWPRPECLFYCEPCGRSAGVSPD